MDTLICRTLEARELAEDFKVVLHETHPIESDVLIPNCIYRWGCPEFSTCKLIKRFKEWCVKNEYYFDETDIQTRYDLYNKFFYKEYNKRK